MHTPAPWPKPEYNNSDMGPGEWYDIPGIARYISKEEDARLIAAAPALLAAILNSDDAHWTPAMRAAVREATEPRP